MYREKTEKLQELKTNFNVFTDSPAFQAELLRSGCLPPLPVMDGYLLWGFSVLKTALREGVGELPCVSHDAGLESGFRLALQLENRTDRYTWREKANILQLVRGFPEITLGKELLSLVQGGSSFVPQTELFLQLPPSLREAADSGLLDIKTAERAADLAEGVFITLEPILASMSFSSRRQFLSMLNETVKRDRLGGPDLNTFIRQLLETERPLELLRRRRYPQLSEMEDCLERYRQKYLRGTGIELIPPPNFEGGAFTLQFAWQSEKQLGRVIGHLSQLKESGNELFRLLY